MHRYPLALSPSTFSVWFALCSSITEVHYVNAGTGMGAAAVFERAGHADELCNAKVAGTSSLLSKDAR